MHNLSYSTPSKKEGCSEGFVVAGLEEAQRKSWELLRGIANRLEVGMSEKDAQTMAHTALKEAGCSRFWHRSIVRLGVNTTCAFSDKGKPDVRLQANDTYFIDLGPVWKLPDHGNLEYEGDVGDTFTIGQAPEQAACAQAARELFQAGANHWRAEKTSGPELYAWLGKEAAKLGFRLATESDGHRIGDFPHKNFSSDGLLEIDFVPSPNVWILEVHLRSLDGTYGAFFEDILK